MCHLSREEYGIYVWFIMTVDTTYNSWGMDMENARKELGKRIREIRKIKELTQEELGEMASLSYKYVGELERGKVNVSLDSLVRISQALEIDIGDLFRKGEESVLRVTLKEKNPLSKLSYKDIQHIKTALRLLNTDFHTDIDTLNSRSSP